MNDLITIAQAAELLGCHPNTIRRHIAMGLLPAYRLGPRAVRLRRAEVVAVLRRIPARATS